jgi:hypothetical protein
MPDARDNDEERFARIERLCEEYRVNHEDLEAYVASIRRRARQAATNSKQNLADARKRLERIKRR